MESHRNVAVHLRASTGRSPTPGKAWLQYCHRAKCLAYMHSHCSALNVAHLGFSSHELSVLELISTVFAAHLNGRLTLPLLGNALGRGYFTGRAIRSWQTFPS